MPNYNLEKCYRAHPLFQGLPRIALHSSLGSLTCRLGGEERYTWVGFGYLRSLPRERPTARGVFGEHPPLARHDLLSSGQGSGLA
jgi:hypothetical protein